MLFSKGVSRLHTMAARAFCAAAVALLATAGFAEPAEDFPQKPIEIVIHTSPGGGTDMTARTMLIGMRSALSPNIVVTPKVGGGGLVALNYAGRRARDGHTLLAITPTHLFAIARGQGSLRIDDLVGVARATDDPLIIVVNAAANAKSEMRTLEDLIQRGKRSPVKWGTAQIGGVDHIAAAIFGKRAGTRIAVVPFGSGGEIVTNLMGQNIEAAGLNLTEALDRIQRGDFRALAVMSEKRLDSLPDVPTTVEKGIPVVYSTVRGYVVLKGTPQDRIDALEAAILQGMKNPAFQSFLTRSGLSMQGIAGSEVWDRQIKQMYVDARAAMQELGMLR
ncbi:MAG: tripartite tricarboxylate transporter substrate binding protein [Acidobacteria bacterium]|nr:tripartite tricarboxylate transporter substrate binding protein [Acidobacteriota bacterium]